VTERLLGAAEDRIRHGGRRWGRESVFADNAASAGLTLVLLKFAFALFILVLFWSTLQSVVSSLQSTTAAAQAKQRAALPAPGPAAQAGVLPTMRTPRSDQAEVIDHFSGTTIQDRPAGVRAYRPPTEAEIRESQRKADEAVRILGDRAPEM
jgi:hypothetical protein